MTRRIAIQNWLITALCAVGVVYVVIVGLR